MIWIILIATLIVFGVLFILYTIGKKVKAEEKLLVKQYHSVRRKVERHNRFAKYSRKHYSKTPTIKKWPMTQDEFLDKKNIELIKDVKRVFDNESINKQIFNWYSKIKNENKRLKHLCSTRPCDYNGDIPRLKIHSDFITIIDMIRNGELVFINDKHRGKPNEKCKIVDLFSTKQLNSIREYYRYIDDFDINEITIEDISILSKHDLLKTRNVGIVTVNSIEYILKEHGLKLRG